jgi:hypothetical protein
MHDTGVPVANLRDMERSRFSASTTFLHGDLCVQTIQQTKTWKQEICLSTEIFTTLPGRRKSQQGLFDRVRLLVSGNRFANRQTLDIGPAASADRYSG